MGLISRVSSRTYGFSEEKTLIMGKNKDVKETSQPEDETEVTKIDKWDHRQVKNSIDDNVKDAVREELIDCEECFKLIDKRLWLAFISCLLCGICCGYDYLYPYPKSHYFMIACIIPYGIVVAYLTYFMMYVESNIIITMANTEADYKYHISTEMGKFDGLYKLTISYKDITLDDKFCVGNVVQEDSQVSYEAVLEKVKGLIEQIDEKAESKKTK